MLEHIERITESEKPPAKDQISESSTNLTQELNLQSISTHNPFQGLSFIRPESSSPKVKMNGSKSFRNGHSTTSTKSQPITPNPKKSSHSQQETNLPKSNEVPMIKALKKLVSNLPDKKLKRDFSGRHTKASGLFSVLEHVTPQERNTFVLEMINLGLEDRRVFEGLRRNVPRIIWFLSNNERIEILNSLLLRPQGRKVLQLSSLIFRQTPNLKELKELVTTLGVERLLDTNKRILREVVAHAILGTELPKAFLPRTLSKYSTRKPVTQKLGEIKEAITERIEILHSHSELKETDIWKRFMRSCRKNLQFLGEGRKQRKTTRGLRDLANSLILMVDLESRFDLIFTNERDKTGQTHKAWSEDELKDVKGVLKQIPKRLILFTPNLHEIKRVRKEEDENTAGARYCTGIIQMADCAKDDANWIEACRGRKSFRSVFAHEIGHGIHFGVYGAQVKVDSKTNLPLYGADPIYEFEDYMKKFGWRVFERKAYSLREGKQVVRLNGRVYKLGVPVVVSGNEVILHYDDNDEMLFARRKNAQFSLDPSSRSNPWEEWAQDFVEYIDHPTRLIQYDPEKFRYYEEHFRKYNKAPKIQTLLSERVRADFSEPAFLAPADPGSERKEAPVPHKKFHEKIYHPSILTTAFKALLPHDQAKILAKLQSETVRANERYVESLSHTFTSWTASRRQEFFSRMMKGRKDFATVSCLLMQSFEKYHPALLAAVNAFYNGEEVGILTSRGDKDGHKPILEAVHSFLGFDIRKRNIYFINDTTRNQRLKEKEGFEKKFHVLCDFLNGYYLDEAGEKKDLSRRFNTVIYYDSSQDNLLKLRRLSETNGHRKDLILIDSSKMSPDTLWESLMLKAATKELPAANSKGTIRFFELDETLVTL